MKKSVYIFLFLVICISCSEQNDKYPDNFSLSDNDVNDTEQTDDMEDLNFIEKNIPFDEKTVKDSVNCGKMVFICGESDGVAYLAGFEGGTKKWHTYLNDHSVQTINALACGKSETSDYFLFAGGDRSLEKDSPQKGFIMSFDYSTGTSVYEAELNNGNSVSVYALTVDSELNLYVAGRAEGLFEGGEEFGGKDGFIAKYDEHFELKFIKQFGTSSFDSVQSLTIGSDGYVLAAGYSEGNIETGGAVNDSEGMKGFVIKFKPDGEVHWKKMYNAVNFWKISSLQLPYSFFVAGSMNKNGKTAAVVYQIGLDGKIKSTFSFPASGNSFGTGFDVDSNRNIYITGYLFGDFVSGGAIPPTGKDSKEKSDIFVGVFDIVTSKLLFSTVSGSEKYDVNPKIVVNNNVPYLSYYSVEDLTSSSGETHISIFENNE